MRNETSGETDYNYIVEVERNLITIKPYTKRYENENWIKNFFNF